MACGDSNGWLLNAYFRTFWYGFILKCVVFHDVCCNHGRCGQLVSFGGVAYGLWKDGFAFASCSGLLMLDMGAAMAQHVAAKTGTKKQRIWLDAKTVKTLKDICGSVLTIAVANTAPLFWEQLTERKLETRFGRLRSSFSNSVMSVADYWRGSLALMKSERQKELFAQGPCSKPISEEEFVECSDQAWSAVRRLFSMCTDCKKEEVQTIFEMHHGAVEADDEEIDDDPPGKVW
jgi:hypothetical protein